MKIQDTLALTLGVLSALATHGVSATQAVDELAQGCFAIRSPTSGMYVKQYHSGGAINDGENFGFRTSNIDEADNFYFKPTRFKHFLVTNQRDRLLGTRFPIDMTAAKTADQQAEWHIQAIEQGSNTHRYRFTSTRFNRTLRHNYNSNGFYFIDLLNPFNLNSETDLELIPKSDCQSPAEMQVNVNGDPEQLKGDPNAPVRGVVDAHTHLWSNEFMGGKFIHGRPFHPYGVTSALPDGRQNHGPWGALDIIGNLMGFNDVNSRHDTRGWPDFPHWPNHQTVSHTGYYYKWIERAWLGGVRMMVSHMVENKVLCNVQSRVNPASWINPNSCETMDSVRHQIQLHYAMQDYIDAQFGGPGKGFFRIVKSPQEAREVIADGKLAILMGIEVSEIFDCGLKGGCTRDSVERQMLEMYDLGIRSFYPTHRFDNKFGGSEIEDGLINVGQWLSTGYLFDVEECDAQTRGHKFTPNFPLIGNLPVIGDIINSISDAPDYDPELNYCNQHGLSELGVYVVNRMIDMGFLIELDHASSKTSASILDIIEARDYSGVISSHSHFQHGVDGQLHPSMKRLIATGGFVAPYNSNANGLNGSIGSYLNEVETTSYVHGVGIGTDMSGLANQPGPRGNAASAPLEYPFVSEFGLTFDRQITGNRVIDFNQAGMAHYGMLADHIQDIREQSPHRIYEAVMNSTEAYLQMWERALANDSQAYHNPLQQEVRIVSRRFGTCVDVPGDDDAVNADTQIHQARCETKAKDQTWLYQDGKLKSAINPELCVDASQTFNHGDTRLVSCDSQQASGWNYANYELHQHGNSDYVLDAHAGNNQISYYASHQGANQKWELRTEREVYNWVTLRTAMGDGCLDVHNADTSNGNYFKLERCHKHPAQLFYYNPKDGSVRSKLNFDKCLDATGAGTANGTALIIWDCHGGANQQWDLDGGVLRSRMDRNKVVDASANHYGAVVHLWDYHGRANQRWRTIVQ